MKINSSEQSQSYLAKMGHFSLIALCAYTLTIPTAYATSLPVLPGPADAGRFQQRQEVMPQELNVSPSEMPQSLLPESKIPANSKQTSLKLRQVSITGMSVFTVDDVKDIYEPYINREITLDTVWTIAGQLTERYRHAGYFLSKVIVPEQEIKSGEIKFRVIEGYIGEVKLEGPLADNRIVKEWLDKLQSYRPLKSEQIESVLLHLNDLPGVSLRAVLQPIQESDNTDGAVRLVLESQKPSNYSGFLSFDNYGSRFLGPYEAQFQGQAVLLPTQRTTFTGLSSLPWEELKYGALKHEMPLFDAATIEFYGSYTAVAPGYSLKVEDIKSRSALLGVAVDYSIIRQREENLNGKISVEGQNTDTDILGTPLTRDATRALRLHLDYQFADLLKGQNGLGGTLSQGINFLGASQAGQENLSREGALPDFTKFNFDASRTQSISDDWEFLTALSSQIASGPLYSSEQFGYGGQAFGRAYDNSEITGDEGISGSLELRYDGIQTAHHVQPVPYGFYDIGAVWALGANQATPNTSGSSSGLGFRMLSDFGFSSNLGLAFPLTRRIADPIYGNGKSPRYFMQLAYGF